VAAGDLAVRAAMSDRLYRTGEIVLMNYHGWLKAFRVVAVHSVMQGDVESTEYQLQMLEMENQPGWQRPVRE
jgi:hypothetical protein